MNPNNNDNNSQMPSIPPAPTIAELSANAQKPKRSKKPIIITAIVIASIAIIIAIVFFFINQPKPNNQESTVAETHEETITENHEINIEYFNENALTRGSYTMSNVSEGFSINNYTFTGAPNISFNNASQILDEDDTNNTFLSLNVSQDDQTYRVDIATDKRQSLEEINQECEADKKCESDYIVGATTIVTAIKDHDATTFTLYSFISSKKLLSYAYRLPSGDYDTRTETAIRSALIKAALTISDKSNKPYLFDIATFFPLPLNRHVNSYKDIVNVSENSLTIESSIDGYRSLVAKIYYKAFTINQKDRIKTDVENVDIYKQNKEVYFIFGTNNDEIEAIFTIKQGNKNKAITEASEAIELYKQITQ